MIQKDAAADASGGVDVDTEDLGNDALQIQRQFLSAICPQVVSDPIGREGLESFKIEDGRKVTIGGRIPLIDGHYIFSDLFPNELIAFQDFLKEVMEVRFRNGMMSQFAGNSMG